MKSFPNRMMRRALLSTAIGLATTPVAALAQAAGSSASASEAQSSQPGGIEDILVTARRSSESQQSVPIAITTVTSQRLTDLNVRDILDIQKVTPGLYVSSSQSTGKARLTIRGQIEVDNRLTGERAVGLYIDGVAYPHTYGLTSSLIDLAQIEVLKGPQGTLFGKNTTGGAINVTTAHPEYQWGGYVDLQYGSYNKMLGLAVVNAPLIDDKLAIRVVGQINSREGYYREADGYRSSGDHSGYGRILVRADPAPNVHLLLSADYARNRDGEGHAVVTYEALSQPANVAALAAIDAQLGLSVTPANLATAYGAFRTYFDAQQANPRLGFGKPPVRAFDNLDTWSVSGNLAVDIGSVTAKSITAYRYLSRSAFYDLDGTPFDLLNQRETSRLHAFSEELQLSSIDGKGLDWQAGLYYSRETGFDNQTSDVYDYVNPGRAAIVDSGVVNSSKAAYAQAVYNITPTWRVTGGARYTRDFKEILSRNRIDPSLALPPLPGGAAVCAQLTPALGGPVFPNCLYTASTTNSKVTWLASTDWRPVEHTMVYASVSRGYKAGGFTPPGTSVFKTQAALDAAFTPYLPETVTSYEVGFKSDLFDRRVRINGSAYYLDYTNIQASTREFTNNLLISIIHNAASATIYGGELEVTAAPTRNLTITGSTGYIHAKYNTYVARDTAGNITDLSGTPFAAPKWTAAVGGTYTVPLSDGSIRMNANYAWTDDIVFAGTAASLPSVTQKAYGLLDARISWHVASQGLDVAVFAKNLTDKIYYQNIALAGPINLGSLGDPRTFGIQARKTF
ncbi:TonB-dependent receptor [Sphingomonas oligophenolica]|uniref:TonB-dependent receptor n=1 Tax=Sphingomonas oligophenolica TaxID=301154 RepID=A0ABU9YB26_9SPHN